MCATSFAHLCSDERRVKSGLFTVEDFGQQKVAEVGVLRELGGLRERGTECGYTDLAGHPELVTRLGGIDDCKYI